jgi:hypothetical protein
MTCYDNTYFLYSNAFIYILEKYWEKITNYSNDQYIFWRELTANPNITWEYVLENKTVRWNWYGLSKNSSITWDIVKKNKNKPWSWYYLSQNSNITLDIVLKNPEEPWNQNGLHLNPNIYKTNKPKFHRKFLPHDKNKHKWFEISKNHNLTIETIEQNLDKIDWSQFSQNKFTLANKLWKQKRYKIVIFILEKYNLCPLIFVNLMRFLN